MLQLTSTIVLGVLVTDDTLGKETSSVSETIVSMENDVSSKAVVDATVVVAVSAVLDGPIDKRIELSGDEESGSSIDENAVCCASDDDMTG